MTLTQRRDSNATGTVVAKQETEFDNLGHIYQRIRFGKNPSLTKKLVDNTFYDARGNVEKEKNAGDESYQRMVYDGVDRVTKRFVAYDAGAGEIVMQQEEFSLDDGSNVIQRTLKERFHNATGSGELNGPTGAEPRARVSYEAFYPDAIGRNQAQANYGSNGVPSFTRSATIPPRSDTILVTSNGYDDTGENNQTTDPADTETRREFDDAGRQTKLIENYVNGGTAVDENRTTETAYNPDGQILTLTAKNSVTGDQVTTWIYGTTLSDSDVASNQLLRAKRAPLGSASDQMEYGYNRLGEVKSIDDENGNVRALDYDLLGRPEHDRVTTLGTNIDGKIRRISRTYEVRGLLETLASYDNATAGSGSIVNEVKYEYNDFAQLTDESQSHEGAVDSSTPKVEYEYEDASNNTVRRKSIKCPDLTKTHYDYGSIDSSNYNLSRVRYVHCGTSMGVNYDYLGVDRTIIANYSCQPAVELTYYTAGGSGEGGDQYTGLDRFGRVIDQCWRKTSDNTDRVRVKYGFNRASNRVWREDVEAPTTPTGHDEYYTYDGLYSLQTMKRGVLNATKTGIEGTPDWEEEFKYNPTGNWNGPSYAYETTDGGYQTLHQNRTHNTENEITNITETAGDAWPTPTHDANGNMRSVPRPEELDSAFDLTWDPWNRLVKVYNGSAFVAEYIYDGADRRVIKCTGSEFRHYYYSDQWQVIEERLGDNDCADCRYIWGMRYQDDLVCRDVGDARLYALHDFFSVVALIDVDGVVEERYQYETFGTPEYMDADFDPITASGFDWEMLYRGYRNDGETGIYQVRNRHLHSNLGRWISRDPLGVQAGTNSYRYAGNNSINRVDPMGLQDVGTIRFSSDGGNPIYYFNDNEFYYITKRPEGSELTFEDTRNHGFIFSDNIPLDVAAQTESLPANNPYETVEPINGFVDWFSEQDWIDDWAGWADALTFTGTNLLRDYLDINEVDGGSLAYGAGQKSQTAIDLVSGGSTLFLRALARRAISKELVRKAMLGLRSSPTKLIRNRGRRFMPPSREGFERHHRYPLFGHPGGASTYFPTGGLPPSFHSSAWNISYDAGQRATHARLYIAERFLIGNAIIGGGRPYTWND